MPPRIPFCEFKDGPCDDTRCKKGFCFEEAEEKRLDAIRIRKEEDAVDREAKRIAIARLKMKRVKNPTQAEIDALVAHPKIRALARRRLKDYAAAGFKL